MSVTDVLARARHIAEESGLDHAELVGLLPKQQIAVIQDRLSRKVQALREEMLVQSIKAAQLKIAA